MTGAQPNDRSAGTAALVVPSLFVLIWTTGFVTARLVAPHAEPLAFVAVRVVVTTIVLAGIALARSVRWPGAGRNWRDATIAGAPMQGIDLAGVF